MMYAQIDVDRDRGRPPLGRLRRRGREPGQRARPDHRRRSRAPTAGSACPGFYDDVVPLTEPDRAAFAALPFDEEAYRAELGAAGARRRGRLHDARAARRPPDPRRQRDLGRLPGRGQQDDHPGPRPRQGQLPARRRTRTRTGSSRRSATHVEEIAPPGVTGRGHACSAAGRPSLTPIDHPATQAAARALEATFGRAPVYIREGGSIPVCASFEQILGLPVVLLGFDPPDQRAHAPNEWMDLDELRDAGSGRSPGCGTRSRRSDRPASHAAFGAEPGQYLRTSGPTGFGRLSGRSAVLRCTRFVDREDKPA